MGCAGDLSKLLPSAATQLQAALTQTSTLEQQLITELQIENDYLRYVSKGAYSCGDPRDPKQNKLLQATDPAKFVSQQKVDEAWRKSILFIAAYVKELNKIVGDTKNNLDNVSSLGTIATQLANVPGFPAGTAAAAKAFQAAISDFIKLQGEFLLRDAALRMEPPLEAAVANIKKHYPAFVGNEALAFAKWDACAQEKLWFIRDNPRGLVRGYPPYFATASGTELEAARVAYFNKREQFRKVPPIADILKKIVEENRKLYQPDVTPASIAQAATNANTIFNDATAAAQSLNAMTPQAGAAQKKKGSTS
jgi:hypothetical protein